MLSLLLNVCFFLLLLLFFFFFQFAITQLIYRQTELQTQLGFLNLPIYISGNLLSYQGLLVFFFFFIFIYLFIYLFILAMFRVAD